jgi:hypothetical protein
MVLLAAAVAFNVVMTTSSVDVLQPDRLWFHTASYQMDVGGSFPACSYGAGMQVGAMYLLAVAK